MRSSVVLLSALAAVSISAAQRKSDPIRQLIGSWKYNTSTLKLELTKEAIQESHKAGKQKETALIIANIRRALTNQLATMAIVFNVDHSFVAYGGKPVNHTNGRWVLQGRKIVVTMNDPARPAPQMVLSTDGKQIATTYSDIRHVTGKIVLVKH